MGKRVFLTGCHGIGKTATALAIAEYNYVYMPSLAGPVAEAMGFDLNQPHSDQQLINYQLTVLDAAVSQYTTDRHQNQIYDRSPLDFAAYMKVGVIDLNLKDQVDRFVQRCIWETMEQGDVLVVPRADLNAPMEQKPNRPKSYDRNHFQSVIDGLVDQVRDGMKVIDVPAEYQYRDRVHYILDRL